MACDGGIILFGRYPVPGQVKTRLIPALGAFGAALLQRRLTEQSLETLQAARAGTVEFRYAGGTRQQVRRWLEPYGIACEPQAGADFGARMRTALEDALARGCGRAVLVGTDVPGLEAAQVRRALDALAHHDVVLGPSTDGGYWLVGLRRPAAIFSGIDWGTPDVLAQTLEAARRRNLSHALLAPLNDIDTPADLAAWRPQAAAPGPYLSVVVPALDEAAHIERTLARVSGGEREIIVVDGGSRDDTVALARRAGAMVIRAPKGRAVQQNAGAAAAKGEILLFLHADTRLPDDFMRQIFDTLMDPSVVLGAFHFKTDYDNPGMRLIERLANVRSHLFKLPYGDQAFFMPAQVFRRVGGFPEAAIAEDLLLARRMARLGRLAMAPGHAVTSGRRWRAIGVWRATAINYLVAGGCLLGMDTKRLAPLYRKWLR